MRNKDTIKLSDHFTTKRLLRYALPTMLMMVFISIYGVVDGFFVSNYAGKEAFAAINLIMPAIMIFGCLGTMIGTGAAALIAMMLGAGRKEEANRYFSMLVEVGVILSLLITVAGYITMPNIAGLLGASSGMMSDAVTYGRTLSLFTLAMLFQYMFQTFMSVAERPGLALIFTIGAGVTNMILDAVFVGGCNLGVKGAAFATGISGIIGGVLPMLYFVGDHSGSLRFSLTGIELRPILKACYNGLSELMSSVSASVVSMVYNIQLMKYAGAEGVAAYGVIMYVQFIFLGAMFGYTFGVSPIIGFHYGAGNQKEMNNLLKKSMLIEYAGGGLMFLLAQLLAFPIAEIFVGYDRELLGMTVHAFRIFLFAFLFSGGNMLASAFFTALNNGTISAVISTARSLGFELATVLILPLLFGLDGIWCAVFVAEVASCIMSWAFLVAKDSRYHYLKPIVQPIEERGS